MESLRRKLGSNLNFYPEHDARDSRESSPSVISVSSDSSVPSRIVGSSDEENPITHRYPYPNLIKPSKVNTLVSKNFPNNAIPIHIPSNYDRPTQAQQQSKQQLARPHNDNDPALEILHIPEDDDPAANAYISPAQADRALRDLMSGGISDDTLPIDMAEARVKGFQDDILLLPHQVIGRAWMRDRENTAERRHGGILADDMGLGKTIQTIARIVDGRPRKSDRDDGWAPTTLVVCPVSLVGQWASEIEKIAIGLTVVQHHGTNRTTNPEVLRRAHVVITTYTTLLSEHQAFLPKSLDSETANKKSKKATAKPKAKNSDSESEGGSSTFASIKTKKKATKSALKQKNALFHVRWWRAVLDEAHVIKNRKTKAAIACFDLEAKFRWCLTGTPMQNNIEELYSLLRFLRIRPLNDWTIFNNQIAQPIKQGNGAGRAMKRLHVVLQKIMLRRLKNDEIDGKPLIVLPERRLEIVDCEFDENEREFYNALERRMEGVVERLMQGSSQNYMNMLLLLLRLRQACDHPYLVSKDYMADQDAVAPGLNGNSNYSKSDSDVDDMADIFGQIDLGPKKCQLCQAVLTETDRKAGKGTAQCMACVKIASRAHKGDSAKIRMIMKLLKDVEVRSGGEEKTIVFSQFTSMLDLIGKFLKEDGIRFVRYDGKMNKVQRDQVLETIRQDKKVKCILISFKAGSIGLNLTACNNVILTDMWWNPALEDQAFDRTHRFGQTRDVNIYKLKIPETVEERILALQDQKRELARAALSGDKLKNMKLGMEELLALFKSGRNAGTDSENDEEIRLKRRGRGRGQDEEEEEEVVLLDEISDSDSE